MNKQKRELYGSDGKPYLLLRSTPWMWRKCVWFSTVVRADDEPYRCLSCRQVVRVGQEVIGRRSAHEQTQGCYGPIEAMLHYDCWSFLKLTGQEGVPELGPKEARMERYGDAYKWAPRW